MRTEGVPYSEPVDDAMLVQQAREGAKEAFAGLYDRYAARLHDFLASMLRDRDDAADVLHDTFLLAGARLHQLRDPAKVRPWLYAIARHQALRRIQQRSRLDPLEETEVTASGPGPADVASQDELAELVQAAAAGLNPRDRVVLDLHLRQGMEGQELGEAIGVSTSHAYVLLSRLRDQVERSLGALLVTRLGRRDCDDLAAMLEGWDGRFTPAVRKRVARHVDGCDMCAERRRQAVSPLALLAAVPTVSLPDALRDRVLGDVELVSYDGRPWPARRDGFPPKMPHQSRARSAAPLAAALLAVLGALALLAGDAGPDGEEVASVASVTTTAEPVPVEPGPTESLAPSAPDPGSSSSTTGGSPATAGPSSTGGASPPARGDADPEPVIDTDGPSLGKLTVTPPRISAVGPCAGGSPTTAAVTISASDPSGVVGVVLDRGAPVAGSVAMRASGTGSYTAAVGPVSGGSVGPGSTVVVPLTVTATDGAGNTSTDTGSLTVTC